MRKTQMVNAKVNEAEKAFCATKVNTGNKSNVEYDELNAVNEAMKLEYDAISKRKQEKAKRRMRRRKDHFKAVRKMNIDKQVNVGKNGALMYNNLHQYSKNKIHCSCPLCAFNGKHNGHLVFKKIYTESDRRKMDSMDLKMKEYMSGMEDLWADEGELGKPRCYCEECTSCYECNRHCDDYEDLMPTNRAYYKHDDYPTVWKDDSEDDCYDAAKDDYCDDYWLDDWDDVYDDWDD